MDDLARKRFERLIEQSSLGTPEAKMLRSTVTDEQVAKVMARLRELEADETCHDED